jgi:hypothetical protein
MNLHTSNRRMVAACSSETSIQFKSAYKTTWCHNEEGHNPDSYRCGNIKAYININLKVLDT